MKKEPSNKSIIFGLYILLIFLSSNLLAQTPSAEVVSADTAICETGVISFKVKFTGTAPFGIAYEVLNTETSGSVIYTEFDPIFDANWVTTLTVSNNTTISIVRVYDDTTGDWSYPGDGAEVTGESMDITVDHLPTPGAGNDISALCGYTATMTATPGDASNPHYWAETADGIFADINDPATTFEANDLGTYTLWFIEESGVCKDSSSVDVELLGSPVASLSGSETICSTDGNSNQITLTVNYNSSFAPYSYTVSDGTNSYNRNDNSVTPDIFSVPATGNQNYTITSMSDTRSGKQCYARAKDMTGTGVVTDLKPAAYAGEDKIVCGELTTTLEATLENPGNTGMWTSKYGSVSFDVPTSSNTLASVTSVITHVIDTLFWTETEPVLSCKDSNKIGVVFAKLPDLIYSKDIAICQGSTATLTLNATGNSPWTLTYNIDGSGTDLVLNTPAETKDFSPESTITVTFDSIVGTYGCVTQLNKDYIITVDEMPIANAGMYDPVCSDQIQLNAVASITNTFGHWQGNGAFDDINSSSTGFTSAAFGEQSLTWTETNSKNASCTSSDVVIIRFDQMPLAPNAGNDKKLYLEFNTTLDADPADAGIGTWSASNSDISFDDVNDPGAIASNLKMGVQTLSWTLSNGVCEDHTDDVVIEIKGLTNPTGFSPNGDGVNDLFKIMGADQIPGNELKVFDRKGKLVHSEKNYSNDWDGTNMDGSPLDDDTYYYIFTGDNIDPIKEYLIIKRSKTE